MKSRISAGDFESKFADLLASELIRGRALERDLVADCYRQAASELGLPPTKAEEFDITDMHSRLLAENVAERRSSNADALSKKIFDAVYMH